MTPFWSDDAAAVYVGRAQDVLRALPAGSVQTVVTSPPYYGLRDYGGHADQIGQEATPAAYVAVLADLFDEIHRVLRPNGTAWLNLGDTYSRRTNRGPSADRHAGRGHRQGVTGHRISTTSTAPLKSLLMMPSRVAIALSERGWIIRNDIIWSKSNAMPSSVTDRMNTTHEHLYLLAKSPSYYFDLDATKVPATGRAAGNKNRAAYATAIGTDAAERRFGNNPGSTLDDKQFENRNPGDVWSIATRPNPSGHFAMFPPDIPLRCIRASTAPGDLVLDPFAGAGTTGVVAKSLGRRFVGIELVDEYAQIAVDRLSATLPYS